MTYRRDMQTGTPGLTGWYFTAAVSLAILEGLTAAV